ncbi:MAG: hypothetical protein JSV80_13900, partial [Acidobacteriota bacterium]
MPQSRSLSRVGRVMFAATIVCGSSLYLWALVISVLRPPLEIVWGFPALFSLTLVAGTLSLRIPGTRTFISLSDTFVFASVILLGPAPAALIAGSEGLLITYLVNKSVRPALASLSVMTISIYLAALAFERSLSLIDPRGSQAGLDALLIPLVLMALVHYAVNSSLVATLTALRLRRSIVALWRTNYAWTALSFLPGALAAGIAVALIRSLGPIALLICLPILGLTYLNFRGSLSQLEQQHAEITTMNRLYLRTLEVLAMAIDARGQSSPGHLSRVQSFAVGLSELIGADAELLKAIRAAAFLHDVGRLGIPD